MELRPGVVLFFVSVSLKQIHFSSQCPFPGIPANANAKINGSNIYFRNNRHFKIGDLVNYDCTYSPKNESKISTNVTCGAYETWEGSTQLECNGTRSILLCDVNSCKKKLAVFGSLQRILST